MADLEIEPIKDNEEENKSGDLLVEPIQDENSSGDLVVEPMGDEEPGVGADTNLFSRTSKAIQNQEQADNVGAGVPSTGDKVPETDDEEEEAEQPQKAQSPQDYLKQLISQMYGKAGTDEAYNEAAANRNEMQRKAIDMMAGQQLAAALSKGAYKPDYAASEAMLKNAPQSVQDVLAQRQSKEAQIMSAIKIGDFADKDKMQNPDSDVSKAYRSLAEQYNPGKDFSGMSAQTIKDAQPMIDTAVKMQALQLNKKLAADAQKDQKLTANEMRASQALQQSESSRMPGGRAKLVINEVERMEDLVSAIKQRPDPTPTNADRVAMSNMYNTVLRNGQSSEGGAHALLDPTMQNTLAKWATFLTSAPQGAKANQAFLDQTLNVAKQMKQSAQKYSYESKNDILDRVKNAVHPDWYNEQKSKYDMSSLSPNPSPQDATGKIKVSNGDKTYYIDPSDVAAAKQDGFLPVMGR